ncbi:MAG: hypothetical protein HY696_07040 [Deltaproteobacteria bacterium]|nr:hypothetical protein [Deltaproteobacteria bacterium]
MGKIISFILVLLVSPLVWGAGVQLPVQTLYGNGQVRLEIAASPDGDDLILRAYDPDGQLTKEEWVQGGQLKLDSQGERCEGNRKDGVVRCEHEDSQTISYYPYRGYLVEGTVRIVEPNGYRRTTYHVGEKNGLDEQFSQYGNRTERRSRHYVAGKLHGKELVVSNGKLARLRTWRANKLDGRCIDRSEYRERVGECRGDEYSGFTGVERSYDAVSTPRKGKSARARHARRLVAEIVYKDGAVVRERRIDHGKSATRTTKKEPPKKKVPPKPGAGGLMPDAICSAISAAVCDRMTACKTDIGGRSTSECKSVLTEQMCVSLPEKAKAVNQATLDQCVGAIHKLKCKALKEPNAPAGCEFMN